MYNEEETLILGLSIFILRKMFVEFLLFFCKSISIDSTLNRNTARKLVSIVFCLLLLKMTVLRTITGVLNFGNCKFWHSHCTGRFCDFNFGIRIFSLVYSPSEDSVELSGIELNQFPRVPALLER